MQDTGFPYLNSDYYISLADILILEPGQEHKLKRCRPYSQNVIFMDTVLLPYYIPTLITMRSKYVLITVCNNDQCVPYMRIPCPIPGLLDGVYQLLISPYLTRWYAKNLYLPVSFNCPKLEPLPLGPKFQYEDSRYFGEPKQPILDVLDQYCLDPVNRFYVGHKPHLLYFHYGDTTGEPFIEEHTGIRQRTTQLLVDNGFVENEHRPFAEYMAELTLHKFAISPPGRGLDTHRTWEALMVGTVPIVMRSSMDPLFARLPVLIVDDYSIVTPDWLSAKYAELVARTDYDFSILYGDYWRHKIRGIRLL